MRSITKGLKFMAILILTTSTIAAVSSDHGKYFEISKNIEIFTNLYKEINTYYVDDLDPAKMMRTGVDAMLESLDPYTVYISESEIEGFRYMTDGKYNGIGAMIRNVNNSATIIELYDDCPAQKAGLRAGDEILSIDGKSTKGKTAEQISDFLKGFPDTKVSLKIQRLGEASPLDIDLTRGEVIVPNVPYAGIVKDGIGYIALTTFTRNAGKNVGDALKRLKKENPDLKGVIFDLRGNGGGLLQEAVNVSNVFIPKGELVVTTKGRVVDWDRSFKTLNQSIDEDIPLVVLIDHGSASASEIVSGVLQDLDRAVLIGQRSYGKGLVQTTRDVGYNSKVKLTTSKYYIPSGRCIQGVNYDNGIPINIPDSLRTPFETRNGRKVLDGGGVKPDIEVNERLNNAILANLQKEFMIFEFGTKYLDGKKEVDNPHEFKFNEFNQFISFLKQKGYNYESNSEKALQMLKDRLSYEAYDENLAGELNAIQQKINTQKDSELLDHKEAITNLIEKDIIGRYYFQKGKIEIGLRNDPEIKEAVAILNNPAKFQSILK